ncbi:hypothetical protein GCM10025880_23330 [Methylorubrum aminovorans]|uniref:hypothetical protein n=1 Tax=Methylorubrum aminovorans TaxID=269069 RepID=UPI0023E9F511|nr:hypothetical protein [Methylorubrum aminovorans]GMA75916.1 hypothetical protein GCM10025880_23330 [Methylorubrum aminovorans]
METLVILAAVAATLLACIFVVTLSKGPRQPPLRLPREEEWADNADEVSKVLTATEPSPIDRGAQVLDAHVLDAHVMGGRMAEGPVIEGRIIKGRWWTARRACAAPGHQEGSKRKNSIAGCSINFSTSRTGR